MNLQKYSHVFKLIFVLHEKRNDELKIQIIWFFWIMIIYM